LDPIHQVSQLVANIKKNLLALAEGKKEGAGLEGLVADYEDGMRAEYEDPSLWEVVQEQVVLFPAFGTRDTRTR
jgi:hypothetical protein